MYNYFEESHDDIYECMNNRSPKEAVVKLLDAISKSEEPGKWQKFMDALSANGNYGHLIRVRFTFD